MAKKKRLPAAKRRRNLVIGLTSICVLLLVALLSVPRLPEQDRAAVAGDQQASAESAQEEQPEPAQREGHGAPAQQDAPAQRDAPAQQDAPAQRDDAAQPDHPSADEGSDHGAGPVQGDDPLAGGRSLQRRDPAPGTPSPQRETAAGRDAAPEAERSGRAYLTAVAAAPEGAGRIAVVIDDVGNDASDLEPFLSFPGELTVAVLPALTGSREAARRARAAGKEVILHLPMAAENGRYPGPGTVVPGEDPHRVIEVIAENLQSVPGAVGVNNHMGSLATADREAMGLVLGYLKARGLFFLDSRTTPDSVVSGLAPEIGIPWLERDIFLDNEPTRAYVSSALEQGLEVAREQGKAILIGHVQNRVVAEVLTENYDYLRRLGYRFVTLGELTGADVAARE